MSNRYNRNRIFLSSTEQESIKKTRILLAGAGIGSIVAECALRFGFESITIIDGGKVEEKNLNCQNYIESDIAGYKAEALAERLKKINTDAKINVIKEFIDTDNVHRIIEGHDIAINALDFKGDISFIFDEVCKEHNISVLHPYNLGWGGFLTIVSPTGFPIEELSLDKKNFELKIVKHVINYGKFWGSPAKWLEDVVNLYKAEPEPLPPPQLSIGSWIAAGFCVNAMHNIAVGKPVLHFPKFYFSSILNGS